MAVESCQEIEFGDLTNVLHVAVHYRVSWAETQFDLQFPGFRHQIGYPFSLTDGPNLEDTRIHSHPSFVLHNQHLRNSTR